jgi:hypothetical protein
MVLHARMFHNDADIYTNWAMSTFCIPNQALTYVLKPIEWLPLIKTDYSVALLINMAIWNRFFF